MASGSDILVASDVGMGLNLNIRRVTFSTLEKFDGTSMRALTVAEIKQNYKTPIVLKKLPYLVLLGSFLQCFCMVFYPISSILDQFFCFICIQFLVDYKDFSQDLMEYMLPPQLPELPQSQHDLTKVLFPE